MGPGQDAAAGLAARHRHRGMRYSPAAGVLDGNGEVMVAGSQHSICSAATGRPVRAPVRPVQTRFCSHA